jgi:FkbM family methyltransferase
MHNIMLKNQAQIRRSLFFLKFRVMLKIFSIMDGHGVVDEKNPRFLKITRFTELKLIHLLQQIRANDFNDVISEKSIDLGYLLHIIFEKLDYIKENSGSLENSKITSPESFFDNQSYYQIFSLNFIVYCLENMTKVQLPLAWFPNDQGIIFQYLRNKITLAFTHPILNKTLFPETELQEISSAYQAFKNQQSEKEGVKVIAGHYLLPVAAESIEVSVFFHRYGLNELPEKILHNLRDSDIIDCGAYIGDSALIFADYYPKSIHCFEPNRHNYNLMLETFKLNHLNNITINQMGVGNSLKNAKITLMGSGSYITSYKGDKIPMTTIDVYSSDNKLKVGLIKMDIEGFETQAVKGAKNTIEKDQPILLISVYHDAEDFFEVPRLLKTWVPEYQFRFLNLDQDDPLMERVLLAYIDK